MRIMEIGERALIEKIQRIFSLRDLDDCAEIDFNGRRLVFTTDCISKKSHIPDDVSWKSVGKFLAAINLSDVASMGATPLYFLSTALLPGNFDLESFEEFFEGLSEMLTDYGVTYIGGDLKESNEISFCGFAIGELAGDGMYRTGWRSGDVVGVTYNLGRVAAAHYLYKLGYDTGEEIIRVIPRVNEGRLLRELGVRKCTDLSDGVYSSALQLMKLNGVGFEFYLSKDILHPLALTVMEKYDVNMEYLAFGYGGDYELMFAVDENMWDYIERSLRQRNIEVKKIGRVIEEGFYVVIDDERKKPRYGGYEHFRERDCKSC